MTPMPEHLHEATRARTKEAEKRARTALAELAKAGKPISFTAVARQAGVSADFLYRSPELRSRIERHRTKAGAAPAATAEAAAGLLDLGCRKGAQCPPHPTAGDPP